MTTETPSNPANGLGVDGGTFGNDPCDPCLAFLRPHELPIVAVMSDGEYVPPVSYVADDLGCDASLVRATHKRMAQFGFANTGPLFREDDGKLAGRGTWLNRRGFVLQDIVRALTPEQSS